MHCAGARNREHKEQDGQYLGRVQRRKFPHRIQNAMCKNRPLLAIYVPGTSGPVLASSLKQVLSEATISFVIQLPAKTKC